MFKDFTWKTAIELAIIPAFAGLYALGFSVKGDVADNATSIGVLQERVKGLATRTSDDFGRAKHERDDIKSNQARIQKQVASFTNHEHRVYQECKTLMETNLNGMVVYSNNKRFGGTTDYIHLISFSTGEVWSYVAETEGTSPYVFSDEVKNLILLRDGSSKSFDDAMDSYLTVYEDISQIHQAIEPSLSYLLKFDNVSSFKEQLDQVYKLVKPDYSPATSKYELDKQAYIWQEACIKTNGIIEKEFQKRKLVSKKTRPHI